MGKDTNVRNTGHEFEHYTISERIGVVWQSTNKKWYYAESFPSSYEGYDYLGGEEAANKEDAIHKLRMIRWTVEDTKRKALAAEAEIKHAADKKIVCFRCGYNKTQIFGEWKKVVKGWMDLDCFKIEKARDAAPVAVEVPCVFDAAGPCGHSGGKLKKGECTICSVYS